MTETHIHEQYVTRDELAELVRLLDRRMDGFERSLNRLTLVFGTGLVLILVIVIYAAARTGL
jgi:hypothetical protein